MRCKAVAGMDVVGKGDKNLKSRNAIFYFDKYTNFLISSHSSSSAFQWMDSLTWQLGERSKVQFLQYTVVASTFSP